MSVTLTACHTEELGFNPFWECYLSTASLIILKLIKVEVPLDILFKNPKNVQKVNRSVETHKRGVDGGYINHTAYEMLQV